MISLGTSLVVSAIALHVGINLPDSSSSDRSFACAILAYSVYDLALVSIMRTAIGLLGARLARSSSLAFYGQQVFILAKIIFRIVVEDVSELVTIDVADELFYFACLFSFLVAMVDMRLRKTPDVPTSPAEPLINGETPPPPPTPEFSSVTISKLLAIVLAEKNLMLGAFVFLVIAAVSQATIPHFIGKALDAVKDHKSVTEPLQGMIEGAIGYAVFSALRGSTFIMLGARVNVNMRGRLFASIVNQDIGFFDKTKTGDLSSRMTQDVQKVCDQVQLNVNYFIRNLIATVVTLSFMLNLSWRLTCLSMISIPVTVVISQRYGEFMKSISKQIQDRLADCNAASEEVFASIHTVRSFGAEDLEVSRFHLLLQKVYALSLRSAKMYVPYLAVCIALPYSASIVIIYYGAKLALAGVIEASALISFVLYLEMLNDSFGAMGDIYASITSALGAAEKVFAILEKKPEFPLLEYPVEDMNTLSIRGQIEFRNVTFSYPSRSNVQVLHGISLSVKAGSVAALVGGSGQGKSSCLALLQRWYCQAGGEILLDGVPIRRYDPEAYHRFVTCVNQEPLLFARSIRDNILFGVLNPGEDVTPEVELEVERCAKLANAHDFILAMPNGYDTQVGMRGVQLSGGQKQRIAIARALVRKPKVLLLDEATSALDSESEKQVQQALDSMMTSEMTLIVVAHRLSTVRNADVIFVVDKGRVAEQGSHDALVKNESSAYYKLVQNQLMTEPSSPGTQ